MCLIYQARKEGKPMAANVKEVKSNEVPVLNVPEGKKEEIHALLLPDEYGNRYRLEFTPRVVKAMERRGFKIDFDYPYSCAEDLFTGAFQANYGGKVTPEQIVKIWKRQTKKQDLVVKLVQLYMNPVNEFMAEPEGADKDADPTWETV